MSLKKLVAITLLLVFLYNLCGIIFVFKYQQYAIRKEMKHKIKAGVPEDQLAKIIVNSENEQELDWKHGKEFRYKGIMYDVVKKEVNEDGSVEPMALVTEKINNTAQANLTNQQLIEGYIGNKTDLITKSMLNK